jgi:hypothetical protein
MEMEGSANTAAYGMVRDDGGQELNSLWLVMSSPPSNGCEEFVEAGVLTLE